MAPRCGDDFRNLATAIVMLFSFSLPVSADFDLSVGTTIRSYPLSGVIEVDTGYDFLLWGEHSTDSIWYGYLRPSLLADSSVSYNSVAGSVDFFPLSFLGGRVGYEGVENDVDYSAYDCNTYACRGRFYHTYAQAQLSLGAGPVFVQGRWKRERWTERDVGSLAFVEPTSGFALSAKGDSETIYRAMLGVKLDDSFSLSGAMIYAQADSGGVSRFPLLLLRYSSEALSAGIGGGAFRSPLKPWDPSVLAFVQWNVLPGLELH